jgi:hypothetical protein
MSEGKISKLKLISYSDPDFQQKIGDYEVLVNPEKNSKKGQINYSFDMTPIGSSKNSVKFRGYGDEKYEFNFFFDGTGIFSSQPIDIQIKKLKDLMYSYNGDIHEPNYIKIFWGTQLDFQGRLLSFDREVSLMDIDGTPIRAEVKAVFISSISAEKKALEAGKNSADLTHIRIVQAGDNLPLMCFKIYGDSSYYIKVARYNDLDDFRNIKPGDQIVFEPAI